MVFGIVVEARSDALVYSALIRRIRPEVDSVVDRPCGGVAGVRRSFVGLLKDFQWCTGAEKALVIRDSDCKDPRAVETELARILDQDAKSKAQITLPFHFYATKCMLETWLLADEAAVNIVARKRGKNGDAERAGDPLEGRKEAKTLFYPLGTDLTGATSVTFNGKPAGKFTVNSTGSTISSTVPAGASTGTVQVVTPNGTLSSNVPFTVQ